MRLEDSRYFAVPVFNGVKSAARQLGYLQKIEAAGDIVRVDPKRKTIERVQSRR